jgi:CheY-like chemotaxis protein
MDEPVLNSGTLVPKARVLLVDDNVELADLIKLGLEYDHFAKVDVYNDPIQCILNYKPGSYNVIFLDIEMPLMDGFQIYRELKKIDRRARVCFLTAFDAYESNFSEIFHEENIERVLKKPVTMDCLKQEISQQLVA